MCRLAGYYIPRKTSLRNLEAKTNLIDLVVAQQTGGYDATGLAFIDKNKFFVHKEAKTAVDFMLSAETAKLMEDHSPRAMIAHCRFQTQGDKANNLNNHPHYTKSGLITIHNGVISNDGELFKKYELTRDAEVDSEILGKLIEFYLPACNTTIEAIQRAFKEIRGSVAMAFINVQEPDALYLVRRENNLNLALDRDSGIIYFATEADALKEILYRRDVVMGFFSRVNNFTKIEIQEIPLGHGVKITRDNVEIFKVESPAYVAPVTTYQHGPVGGTQTNLWCPVDKCPFNNKSCKHSWTEVNTLIADRQAGPTEVKKNSITLWEADKRKDFTAEKPIKKPSKYSDQELTARLRKLHAMEVKAPLELKLENECKRIEMTLDARDKLLDRHFPD